MAATYFDHLSTGLAKAETITDMVNAHNKACLVICDIHTIVTKYPDVSVETCCGQLTFDFNLGYALQKQTQVSWHEIIKKSQVEEACSDKRWKSILKQIDAGDMPEFTEANILEVVRSLGRDLPKLFKECCEEVLKWLQIGYHDNYKTNEKNARMEIGPKIIKAFMVENWGFGYRLSYYYESILRSLDTVFKLLDGKGVSRYPDDLPTLIAGVMKSKENIRVLETPYFKLKWYAKGTLHIEFLRLDLLAEFNAVVHGNTLREPVST